MAVEFASLRFLAGFTPQFSLATALLDGPGDRIGSRFVAQKTGIIDRIACYCTAVASPVTTEARLESISASYPTGTLLGTNTSGTFTPTASTVHVVPLTASYAVQAGELIAAVLNAPTATATNTQTFNLRTTISMELVYAGSGFLYPSSCQNLTAGAWSSSPGYPCIVPVYSDGTWMSRGVTNPASVSVDFNNTTNPDERGNRWTQPVTAECIGAWLNVRQMVSGANWNIKLYPTTSADAAPWVTYPIVGNTFVDGTANSITPLIFWNGIELKGGEDYRLTYQPTNANNIRVVRSTFASAVQAGTMSQMVGTSRLRTSDGDAGAWTDVATEYVCLVPIFRSLTTSSSTGGRRPALRTLGT